MKRPAQFHVNLGITSILMIFVVLCMVILSALSLLDARQSLSLAQREVQQNQQYHKAETMAKSLLANLQASDDMVIETAILDEEIATFLGQGHVTFQIENDILNVVLPLMDKQSLYVSFQVVEQTYQIQSWELKIQEE